MRAAVLVLGTVPGRSLYAECVQHAAHGVEVSHEREGVHHLVQRQPSLYQVLRGEGVLDK